MVKISPKYSLLHASATAHPSGNYSNDSHCFHSDLNVRSVIVITEQNSGSNL